jgi:Zn-dependent protease
MSAVLGWGVTGEGGRNGLYYLALWVVCVFVSVLIHEFGHIFMGRLFGSHGHIVLYSFGGLAVGSNTLNRGWQRFLVSFAGPLIQFVVLGITFLAAVFLLPKVPKVWQEPAAMTLGFLFEINLFWPLLNLLPIWPLDGGQMAREVFVAASPRNGDAITLAVSAGAAGLVAFHCVFPHVLGDHVPLLNNFGGVYMALFFGLFCFQSIMALQAQNARRRRYNEEEEFPWER